MTLSDIFSATPKNSNNFNTTLFETNSSTITNTISSLSHQQQQQQPLQSEENSQQKILKSSSFSATNLEKTNTMFEINAVVSSFRVNLIPENQKSQLLVECVMPNIYLTKDFISCKEEQLRAHGFTHIIIIDKHIQELYYPNQQPDIFKPDAASLNNSCSLNAFDYYCSPVPKPRPTAANHLNFGKEFQVIDLNFGEKSYLTTVLPNCYRGVKFINKALQNGGTILVIDCNGGEQKCLTIIVAYLMYKNNISFSKAFARLKEFYKKADLDRFYISQLYEYEPILQVQRAQSRGHSCSRKLHAAILKRKKAHDDDDATTFDNNIIICSDDTSPVTSSYTNTNTFTNAATATELLNNFNPLNRFDSTRLERLQKIKSSPVRSMTSDNLNNIPPHTFTRQTFTSEMTSSTTPAITGGWYNWDDFAME